MQPDAMQPDAGTLAAHDGTRLATLRWRALDGLPARGSVVIVHGLGEHAGRYAKVAAWLGAQGWETHAFDHRGHGRSEGVRGSIRHPDDFVHDIATVIDAARAHSPSPLILLGHSMGGPFAARIVAEGRRPLDGLVLSSPALDPGLSRFQRLQLTLAHALVPGLAVGNGLDPDFVSHDPEVVRAYRADPLVHDRVTARVVRAILDAGARVLAAAPTWRVPTLLLYAGADRLVAPRGSDAFRAAAPGGVVEAHRFDALYHEILNESASLAAPVYETLARWLRARGSPVTA